MGKEKEESGAKVPSKKRKSQRLDFASARQCASLEPELNCQEDSAKAEAARPRLSCSPPFSSLPIKACQHSLLGTLVS